MKCAACRERLTDLVDDRLLDAERAGLAAHLEACAACRSEADAQRALRASLRAIGPAKAPFGALDAARSALREEMSAHPQPVAAVAAPPSLLARLGPFRIAATLVAGVLTGLILYRDVIDPRRRAETTTVAAARDDDSRRAVEHMDEADRENRIETADGKKPAEAANPSPTKAPTNLVIGSEAKTETTDWTATSDGEKPGDAAKKADQDAPGAAAKRVVPPEGEKLEDQKIEKKAAAREGLERLKAEIVEELARQGEPQSRNRSADAQAPAPKAVDLERAAAAAAGWLDANAANVLDKSEGGEGLASGESFRAVLEDSSAGHGAASAPGARRDATAAPANDSGEPSKKTAPVQNGSPTSAVPVSYAYLLPSGADATRLTRDLGALGLKIESTDVPIAGKSDAKSRSITVEVDAARRDEILAKVATSAGAPPHLLATLGRPRTEAKPNGDLGLEPRPNEKADAAKQKLDAAEARGSSKDESRRKVGAAAGGASTAPETRPAAGATPRAGRRGATEPSGSQPSDGRKIRLHFIVP